MNAQFIKYGIIAAAVVVASGVGFGGYKGTKALARKRAEKKAARKMQSTVSPMGNAASAANADIAEAAAA
jgi:hypothetical protein